MKVLTHEALIKNAFSKSHWDRIEKWSKSGVSVEDKKWKKLRDHLLGNDIIPNVMLLSGIDVDLGKKSKEDAPPFLDLPFSCCVIEAIDKELFGIPSMDDVGVLSLLVAEFDGEYHFLVHATSGTSWSCHQGSGNHKFYMIVVQEFCKFINSKTTKVGKSKAKLRYKHPKFGKKTIRKIVHIKGKSSNLQESHNSKTIDWSHKWEVRGHWRSIGDKIGKDRNGNYNRKGFTWVKNHVKGDGELVKKTRLLD